MKCRICGAAGVRELGVLRAYIDREFTVFTCPSCRCRFTAFDPHVHETLHSTPGSTYDFHKARAEMSHSFFVRGDVNGLRRYLESQRKDRFIISNLAAMPAGSKVLEMGCSKGYLTSYFIMRGIDVVGVDVSHSAIQEAIQFFGDHFCVPADPRIEANAPYEAVFHLGTIGCVDSPIEFTMKLLKLLKPGGLLLFNAPSANALRYTSQLWLNGTMPPDLTTLFSDEFWAQRFSSEAEVKVWSEEVPPHQKIRGVLSTMRRRSWNHSATRSLLGRAKREPRGLSPRGRRIARRLRRTGMRALDVLLWLPAASLPRWPAEFATFVTMRKDPVADDLPALPG